MFTLNAVDARRLQSEGIPQSRALATAFQRCQSAIIDTAQRGRGSVDVAVNDLSSESFEALKQGVTEAGFQCLGERVVNEICRLIQIGWDEK